jgi:uncharacterized protein YgbK (DUF1537 family)
MTNQITPLPPGPLLAYYGDDFTGSTDVMEAFTAAGVATVLFLKAPSADWVQRFSHMRCIGLAGTARGHTPDWMDAHLPQALRSLTAFGAPLLQYKVCSTFDSSPQRGSIGQAIDLGVQLRPGSWSPMIVGVPRLGRYQAFGNLFAAMGPEVHRLDRHPTMSRHPVTPMRESDLRRHLSHQTDRRLALIDLVALKQGQGDAALQAVIGDDTPVVLLDVMDEETLAEAGRLVWAHRGPGVFSASSSGLEYALVAPWRQSGLLPDAPALPKTMPVPAIAAVSGSCSPVTAAQIDWACQHGFVTERLNIGAVLHADRREAEIGRVVGVAVRALGDGRSPLIYSAAGPDDPAVTGFAEQARAAGHSMPVANELVGQALAETMRQVVLRSKVRRLAIAGGDSSGAVAGALDITALTVSAQLVPGAPLCRVWSDTPGMDGMELVLKGGQMGQVDFFGRVLHGIP